MSLTGTVMKKESKSGRYLYYLDTEYKTVLVYTDTDEIPIGAEACAVGVLEAFSSATNEGSFDLAQYYRNQQISFRLFADVFTKNNEKKRVLREGLYQLQKRMCTVFSACLNEEEAGVLSALVTGNRGLLDSEIKALYQEAGISHLLAISGLHISILGMGLFGLLRRMSLGFPVSGALSGALVFAFVLMSGMGVSARRALLMFLVLMGAQILGRAYDSLNALALAAILILLQNPMELYQSGFQYSFLSLAAILLTSRLVTEGKALRKAYREMAGEKPSKVHCEIAEGKLRKVHCKIAEGKLRKVHRKIARGLRCKRIIADRNVQCVGNKEREQRDGNDRAKKVEMSGERGSLEQIVLSRTSELLWETVLPRLREALLMGAMLQLFLLPLTAWNDYEVPLYAMFLNLLVIPLCSILLGTGLLGGIVGLFFLRAAGVILTICHGILWLYEKAISLTNLLPFHRIITGKPSAWLLFAYYLLLFLGGCTLYLWMKDEGKRIRRLVKSQDGQPGMPINRWQKMPAKNSQKRSTGSVAIGSSDGIRALMSREIRRLKTGRIWATVCGGVVLLLLAIMIFLPRRVSCRIDFLDVGQGSGIFLCDGAGTCVMIDGGSSTESSLGTYVLEPFLKYLGVRQVDAWILTHADADHYSGLLELLEDGYPIRSLIFSSSMPEDEAWEALVAAAEVNATQVVYVTAGDELLLHEAGLVCLYPTAADTGEDTNALSQVWQYTKGELSILFTGDIGTEQEELLIQRGVLTDSVVLSVAHHGSKNSSGEEFLSVVSPAYAVISAGEGNSYGHPHAETLARLADVDAEILETQDCGQITFEEKKGVWWLNVFVGE